MVKLFEHIHASGVPNFQCCRIPLPTKFNMPLWHEKLRNYEDRIVCEFLEFGFPIDFQGTKLSFNERRNHKKEHEIFQSS